MFWIAGVWIWIGLGMLVMRWHHVAVGPKSPAEQRRDDEDQARALGLGQDDVLIDAALADCYGEEAVGIKAQADRLVTGHPRSLPRDFRRVG